MIAPSEPTGNSSIASWCRRLLRWCLAGRLRSGVGYRVIESTGGTTLEFLSKGGTPSKMEMCQISTLHGTSTAADYFSVVSFADGVTYGDEFAVAKSIPSRMHASRTYYGTSYDYTYTDDNNRTSDDGATEEEQVMLEPFVVGDTVFVMDVSNTGVTVADAELNKIEVNTEREWCGPAPA